MISKKNIATGMLYYSDLVEHLNDEIDFLDILINCTANSTHTAKTNPEKNQNQTGIGKTQFKSGYEPAESGRIAGETLQLLHKKRADIDLKLKNTLEKGFRFPWHILSERFGLDKVEQRIILICFLPVLMPTFKIRFDELDSKSIDGYPSIDLLHLLMHDISSERISMLSCISSDSTIITWHIVEWVPNDDVSKGARKSNLTINKRIADFILGISGNEALLIDIMDKKQSDVSIDSLYVNKSQKDYLKKIEQSLRMQLLNESEKTCLWFYFYGNPGCEKKEAALSICSELSLPVINVNSMAILQSIKDPALLSRLLIREGILTVSGIIFHNVDVLLSEDYRSQYLFQKILKVMSEIKLPVFFLGTERIKNNIISQYSSVYELEILLPDTDCRMNIWKDAFASLNVYQNDDCIAQLSERFNFSKEQIFSIVNSVSIISSDVDDENVRAEIISNECQKRQITKLPDYSTKVASIFSWDDLILPNSQKEQLESICIYMEYRNKVFETWGFRNKIPYGQGVSVLFTGVSGTGKTMAAGILGKRLHRDVYKIDLSLVVSKYIGETEKNISAVFDEAESTGAVLFFDEADALFGKRSSVRDAHDRYANIEVAYLLQKMEEYSGVTILATNFKQNMDDAFTRRIQFIVEFPLPEKEDRELLWRKAFPDEAPLHPDIDYKFLARKFNLSGANIRNISLDAAFRASDEKTDYIQMAHIIKAIKQECKKTGTFITEESLMQYVN